MTTKGDPFDLLDAALPSVQKRIAAEARQDTANGILVASVVRGKTFQNREVGQGWWDSASAVAGYAVCSTASHLASTASTIGAVLGLGGASAERDDDRRAKRLRKIDTH